MLWDTADRVTSYAKIQSIKGIWDSNTTLHPNNTPDVCF